METEDLKVHTGWPATEWPSAQAVGRTDRAADHRKIPSAQYCESSSAGPESVERSELIDLRGFFQVGVSLLER